MNINLDDKKIKKIVYAIDDISEMDIIFSNGEITSLNRRYLSGEKIDTVMESIMETSKRFGKKLVEGKKAKNDSKDAVKKYYNAKTIMDMVSDGRIDNMVKDHRDNGTLCWEDKEEAVSELEKKIENEGPFTCDEKTVSEFKEKVNESEVNEDDTNSEETESTEVKTEEVTEPKEDLNLSYENISEPIKRLMPYSPPKEQVKHIIKNSSRRTEVFKRLKNAIGSRNVMVLMELDKLGYYDLSEQERIKKTFDYIKKATKTVDDKYDRFFEESSR